MVFEFAWACGPPIGMKAHFSGAIDSKWVNARLPTKRNRNISVATAATMHKDQLTQWTAAPNPQIG